jgi:hypothetical protein
MGIISGPFTVTKFLGCSVIGMSSSVGWNEQPSSCTISLVEDTINGDFFLQPIPGSPQIFRLDQFEFQGIVIKWERGTTIPSGTTYQVILNDPRELLSGVQVVLAAWTGQVPVPNLLNCYGYWQNVLGFGGSLTNDSGMIWSAPYSITNVTLGTTGGVTINNYPEGNVGILPAIQAMTGHRSLFGGPVQFRDWFYQVDLSGLPSAPTYYRMGGVSRSLLEIVSQICQDAGCDYMVVLDGGVIKFRSVSRTYQPAIGTIGAFVTGDTNATAKSYGVELRNDITNAVLLGGDVYNLYQVTSNALSQVILPFWGLALDGSVIEGNGDPNQPGYTVGLNCNEVADIVGDVVYPVDLIELRTALASYESWAYYVMAWYPDKALQIGIANSVDPESELAELFPDILLRRDLIAQAINDIAAFGAMNASDFWSNRCQRMYEFVRSYASNFFGKQFLVRVPFYLYWKYIPETTQLVSSEEVSTEGGYVPEGADPLGLPYQNIDAFMTEDGRIGFYATIPYSDTMDLSGIDWSRTVLANGYLYVSGSPQTPIYYPAGSAYPWIVVSLDQPIYDVLPDPLGGVDEIAQILNMPTDAVVAAAGYRMGSFPVRITPAPYLPTGAAIPMKDNQSSYGPWGTFGAYGQSGAAGKTSFDRDESMVPWNYGDYNTLNEAAAAMLSGAATFQQEAETGSVEDVGTPSCQLGDSLYTNGPNVTSIDCQVSTQGVTTSYRMQTFTPQFGAFQKANADRLRRLGIAAQQIRRSLRQLFLRENAINSIENSAYVGAMANAAYAIRQGTPHDVIMASMTQDSQFGYRTQAGTMTVDEMMANMRGDDDDSYNLVGGMGMEGLYRPFATAWDPDDAGDMPHFEQADMAVFMAKTPCTQSVDPIRYSDIDILVNGQGYANWQPPPSGTSGDGSQYNFNPASGFGGGILPSGFLGDPYFKDKYGNDTTEYYPTTHRLKGQPDYDHARGVGLRGPAVMIGYGSEFTGKPVPNKNDMTQPVHTWSDTYSNNAQLHPEDWKAGVVLLHWDDWRKGWGVPTTLRGVLKGALTNDDGSASAPMQIQVSGIPLSGNPTVPIYNDLGGGTIASGTRVAACHDPLSNRWMILGGVACSGS